MGMIKDLWEIGKDIFDISDTLKASSKENKKALAELFLHIGDIIKDTYEKLLKKQYPSGNCEQLEILSKELYDKIEPVVGEIKARALSSKLLQAHRVELLHREVRNENVNPAELEMLDEAAGNFIVTAELLKV